MAFTPRQRVAAAIRGESVDRLPVGPLATHYCAELIGATLQEYTLSAKTMAHAVSAYAESFPVDAVWVSADTWVTAEAMGADVAFTGVDQPLGGTGNSVVRKAADVASIPTPDVERRGRYPLMVEATKRVREAVGADRSVVACFDQYPFSTACALMGVQRAMIAPFEEPALLEATMRKAADFAVAYGKALADAGADVLSGGDSPAGLLGPAFYEEIAAPLEREVITRLQEETGLPVTLHICGDSSRLLLPMAGTGADVLELDHQVSIEEAVNVCGPNVAIWGNLDPVGLLLSATAEDVAEATEGLVQQVRRLGHPRFIVSGGCTLAVGTPSENIHSMVSAVANTLHAAE